METLILTAHVIIAVMIIGLILLQHGKGADAGTTFGAGNSGTVFGAAGSGNFLSRTTAILTAIFFASSLGLAVIAKNKNKALYSIEQTQAKENSADANDSHTNTSNGMSPQTDKKPTEAPK